MDFAFTVYVFPKYFRVFFALKGHLPLFFPLEISCFISNFITNWFIFFLLILASRVSIYLVRSRLFLAINSRSDRLSGRFKKPGLQQKPGSAAKSFVQIETGDMGRYTGCSTVMQSAVCLSKRKTNDGYSRSHEVNRVILNLGPIQSTYPFGGGMTITISRKTCMSQIQSNTTL